MVVVDVLDRQSMSMFVVVVENREPKAINNALGSIVVSAAIHLLPLFLTIKSLQIKWHLNQVTIAFPLPFGTSIHEER